LRPHIRWDAALTLAVGGGTVNVVDLDGLLQLKFRAGGTQDLPDAARLVLLHPESEARARELATARRARDRFDSWLHDPRVLVQFREEADRETRRSMKPAAGHRSSRRQEPRR
jgi:hypothetical protein